MLVSPFEMERRQIFARMEQINHEVDRTTDLMSTFQSRDVDAVLAVRSITPVQFFRLNCVLQQATNFSLALWELKKAYLREIQKLKDVDHREILHNELKKFQM
ncbi:hypothetical protein CRE_01705 [Caenorhabditis remanei]|uniref:Uncharacterized protein n=1 Tax=Caenorhabditis remanei TaxID=31234 RepID=E3LF11_CAERE|nr:hypothetical protein CRE_01705 [Caenorhabditis remanei]